MDRLDLFIKLWFAWLAVLIVGFAYVLLSVYPSRGLDDTGRLGPNSQGKEAAAVGGLFITSTFFCPVLAKADLLEEETGILRWSPAIMIT